MGTDNLTQSVYVKYERTFPHMYAWGVATLRSAGEQPKTLAQNIEACVTSYENGDNALMFGLGKIYSSTAVAIKQKSTKIKIVPRSEDLITLPEDFSKPFIPVVYDKVERIEFDTSLGKYNQSLRKGEPLVHKGWLEAVGDHAILKAFHDIVFKGLKHPTGMGFCVPQRYSLNIDEDRLEVLCLDPYSGNVSLGRTSYLFSCDYFLRDNPPSDSSEERRAISKRLVIMEK